MKPLHAPIQRAVLDSLERIFYQNSAAEKVVDWNLKNQKKWGARDRRQYAEAVYEIVRHWRFLYLAACGCEPSTDLQVGDLEKIIAYHLADAETKTDQFTTAQKESIPDWLYEYCQSEIGADWPKLLSALNRPAPQYLRVNELLVTRGLLQKRLASDTIETEVVPEVASALRLKERKNVFTTNAFKEGLFEMQDAGSQKIAVFLAPQPGERVVDACAGAGGKTLHLAALMQNKGQLLALDVHQWKLDELKKRARRAKVSCIETRLIESTKVIKRLEESADRLLLDVPCSGLGVLRRHPDTKWKLQKKDLEDLAVLQADILARYTKMVRPGGVVVYSTCSILPSENHERVQSFLNSPEGQEFELISEWTITPLTFDCDGFYAASLKRRV
jgi:16S rRNA (cytosine967-C5)-methyltransferase